MATSPENRYWGGWATTAFAIAVLLAWTLGQTVGVIAYVVGLEINDPGVNIMAVFQDAESDGTLLSIATIIGALAGGVLTVVFAWVRPNNDPLLYLGLNRVTARTLLICLGITTAFIVIADSTTYFLGRDVVPEFVAKAYESVAFKPLLWLGMCLFAPVFEELFFRGFLIPGWSQARFGTAGAILFSTAVWVAVHTQYGPYELSQVAILGLIFGAMRVNTGSVVPPMVCHMFSNVVATTEAAMLVNH